MWSEDKHLTGTFLIPDEREVFGSLRICGEDSEVVIFHDDLIPPVSENYFSIMGELHDGRLVSLLQCVLLSINSKNTGSDRKKHSARLFPHYVVLGSSHISPSDSCIVCISFVMKDASALFYDYDTFSIVLDTKPFIPLLQKDKEKIRNIEIGEHPIISYFTGKFDIAVVETALGEVKAHHSPSFGPGGPQGVRIDNKVVVTLPPPEPVTFQDAINRMSVLLRFFELVLGKEQPLIDLTVRLSGQMDNSPPVSIYRSYSPDTPNTNNSDKSQSPHPADVLVSIVDKTEQYSTVLINYLASDSERHDSRARLRSELNIGHHYTINRLIAAANIFDILPDTAYPEKPILSQELATAKEKARNLFKVLPNSIERSSMLGAIGRIGGLSLKHKIRYRVINAGLDKYFPRLMEVLEEAVNCRNHYVHGTPGRLDYSSNVDLECFFTDAMEFTFAASDLIDAGWDFMKWSNGSSG